MKASTRARDFKEKGKGNRMPKETRKSRKGNKENKKDGKPPFSPGPISVLTFGGEDAEEKNMAAGRLRPIRRPRRRTKRMQPCKWERTDPNPKGPECFMQSIKRKKSGGVVECKKRGFRTGGKRGEGSRTGDPGTVGRVNYRLVAQRWSRGDPRKRTKSKCRELVGGGGGEKMRTRSVWDQVNGTCARRGDFPNNRGTVVKSS